MNKQELIKAMAEKNNMNIRENEEVLNSFIETVEETVGSGEAVSLIGFGTFERRERAARTGINPQKPNEKIEIPAKKAPAFKAGKKFKEICNK